MEDLREILGYFGHRTFEHLADLAEKARVSGCVGIDPRSASVLESWMLASAFDWLAASRHLRPIATSSIAVVRREFDRKA